MVVVLIRVFEYAKAESPWPCGVARVSFNRLVWCACRNRWLRRAVAVVFGGLLAGVLARWLALLTYARRALCALVWLDALATETS